MIIHILRRYMELHFYVLFSEMVIKIYIWFIGGMCIKSRFECSIDGYVMRYTFGLTAEAEWFLWFPHHYVFSVPSSDGDVNLEDELRLESHVISDIFSVSVILVLCTWYGQNKTRTRLWFKIVCSAYAALVNKCDDNGSLLAGGFGMHWHYSCVT